MKRFFLGTLWMAALMLTPVLAQQNAQTPVPPRQERQQQRIAQGVKSGQLTAGETARLESRDARINRQIARERQANGGKLSAGERKQANQELNHTSRAIYRDKHNDRVQK